MVLKLETDQWRLSEKGLPGYAVYSLVSMEKNITYG